MNNAEAPGSRDTWLAMMVAGVLCVVLVVVGPAADPAGACDCSPPSDAMAFEQSDAVFVGRLAGYEPPPTRAVMSSVDPATWTFEVSEVYKGDVAAVQEIVSEVSGASCGLGIPREGTFLAFATDEGFDVDAADGQYHAGLCGGTRSTSAGPLAVDAAPSPPRPEQETATGGRDDESTSPLVFGGLAVALAIGGAAIVTWRRLRDAPG